jgi:hypothetical protein
VEDRHRAVAALAQASGERTIDQTSSISYFKFTLTGKVAY